MELLGAVMRRSIRTRSPLFAVLSAALLLGVMAGGTLPAYAASTYLPPALYSGGDVILSGTAKITSPPTGGQPSAGLYIKGKFTNTSSGSVSTVKQYLGMAAPALTVFMPDSRVSALIQASQAAPKVVAPAYNGLTLSGTASQSYPAITVNGNLIISGSGTYTFASAYVTGNVVISNANAKFTFGSLYVSGTLTVSAGTPVQWGPTYVAGNSTLSGSGQWNVSLIVTAGTLTISGSQTMGGDGVGTHPRPATILLTGHGKAMTSSSSGTYYGLLCNRYGGQTTISGGTIKGSVLCNGSCVLSNASIAYDPNAAAGTLDLAAPTTTASLAPTANAAGWINSSSVQVTLNALDNGWAGVLVTYYKIDGGAQAIYTRPFSASFADGAHTISYWSVDNVGNIEDPAQAATVKIDTKAPSAPTVTDDATWHNAAVTVTASGGSDPAPGSGFRIQHLEGTTWVDGAGVTMTAEGTSTASFRTIDNAGNPSATVSTTRKIDTKAPSAPTVTDDATWHNSDVTVTARGSIDATPSGGLSYQSRVGTSGTWSDGDSRTLKADHSDGSTEGENTVQFRAVDAAGNTSDPVSATVKIDTIAPTPTLTVTSPLADAAGERVSYYNEPVLHFDASDEANGSGLTSAGPQIADGSRFVAATSDQPLSDPLADGGHSLTITAQDKAGNTGTASYGFRVAAPPFKMQSNAPYEGDVIGLYADDTAATGNPDGGWEGKTWQWRVFAPDLPGLEPVEFEGPVGFLALADGGSYGIRLTVTDGTSHAKSVTQQTVSAQAQAPWANALDIEVLDGQPATLLGRFLDPGWPQTHEVAWSLDGADVSTVGTVAEDNVPAMCSGYASGITEPLDADHGPYHGELTVTDSTSQSTTVPFTVTPVPADSNADEDQDGSDTITRPASSPVIKGGEVHLSYIQSAGDVDIFEVRTPTNQLLPYGTEVLVTLRNLPADYDVAVIQDFGEDVNPNSSLEASSFATASVQSWMDSPMKRTSDWTGLPMKRTSDWTDLPMKRTSDWSDLPMKRTSDWAGLPMKRTSPFRDNAYVDSPMKRTSDWTAIPMKRTSDWSDVPMKRTSGYLVSPLTSMLFTHMDSPKSSLDGYSFAEMGFTGLGDTTASGSEVTFASLGFSNEAMQGKRIAGFSAHAGPTCETVLVKTDFANGRTYIAVKGANGAWSDTEPYALQVETSLPLSVYNVLDQGPGDPPLVDTSHQTTETVEKVLPPTGVEPLTLFVTQAERINALYGDGSNEDTRAGRPFEHVVLPALRAACNDQDRLVRGEVISVPSTLFNPWDAAPWRTVEANKVASAIRDEIQRYLRANPTIKYVVLVGGDEVIPQRRVQDQTTLSNERDYAERSWLKARGPVAVSMFDCTVLTDDYYVDAQPIPFNGRSLYIPDMAVSRLVETPDEILGSIDEFLSRRGKLDGRTSVITGQGFMADGAQRVNNILAAADLDSKLLTDSTDLVPWTVNDVRYHLLSGQRKVGNINAHFTHYGGISAEGYTKYLAHQDWSAEFLSSTEIAGATNFIGRLFFSMGCHAGLSVPDDQAAVANDYAEVPDPRLDIAQAVAQRRGVLLASTGYGYGDLEGIAGTEALIGDFAEQATAADEFSQALPKSGQPIGLALAAAKRQYLGSLTAVSPYDEKSSIQFAMYGMPQYRMPCEPHAPSSALHPSWYTPQAASFDGAFASRPFVLNVTDPADPDQPPLPPVQLVEASRQQTARFITAGGDAQATPERPIQPRVVVDLGSAGNQPVKSAIVTSGTYVDISSFDPAISRWTTEWEANPKEIQVATDGWWPETPVQVRTVGTSGGGDQRLIVLPGQFRSTSAAGGSAVTGVERLWTSLDVELIRGSADDNIAPSVNSVDLVKVGDTVTAKVDASDASGVSRIDVTQDSGGIAAHFSRSPVMPGGDGTYDLSFDAPGIQLADVAVTVYVVDGAGNVTAVTGKGELVPSATHTLTASAGAHGGVSPSGETTVSEGADYTYSIAPDAHYHVVDVVVDGASQGALTSYTFTGVTEDRTITASFAPDTFTLSYAANAQGSISGPTPQTVAYGTDGAKVTAVANSGYHFVSWSDGVLTAARTEASVTSDITVTASFAVDQSGLTITSPKNGATWPVGSVQNISWTGGDGGPVTIDLSRDNGVTRQTLFFASGASGSVSWTVTGPTTTQALMIMSDGSSMAAADFTIAPALFGTHVDYETGSNPWGVAIGDFNGDSTKDLAVANHGAGTVSVLLGNANGTFQAKVDYTSGLESWAVAVGDFNGDSVQDLAVTNNGAFTVSILLGNGDGTFQAKVDFATGNSPYGVAVGDFNGDGAQDLAVASARREHRQRAAGQRRRHLSGQGRLSDRRWPIGGRHRRLQRRRQRRTWL